MFSAFWYHRNHHHSTTFFSLPLCHPLTKKKQQFQFYNESHQNGRLMTSMDDPKNKMTILKDFSNNIRKMKKTSISDATSVQISVLLLLFYENFFEDMIYWDCNTSPRI